MAWRLFKAVLLVLIVAYVGRALALRLDDLPNGLHLDYGYLVAASVLAFGATALLAPIYRHMQEALGIATGAFPALLVAFISPVGKYAPGKLGGVAGAIWIYRAFGVGPLAAAGVTLLSASATFAAVSILLTPFMFSRGFDRFGSTSLSALVIAAWVVGILLAFPRLFLMLLNALSRMLGRTPMPLILGYPDYFRGIAWTAVQLLLSGAAFWLIARAVGPVALGDWYFMTVSLTVSGIVGFFAFFAPAGIGVREGLLLVFLSGCISESNLALAALLLRLNQILVEIILALLGAALWQWWGCERRLLFGRDELSRKLP